VSFCQRDAGAQCPMPHAQYPMASTLETNSSRSGSKSGKKEMGAIRVPTEATRKSDGFLLQWD
jgi:hypothetical protein